MEKVPRDIFFNIFSRLPLKSVIQSSSVSKSWLNVIKDPSFVKLYFSRSKSEPSLLILTRRVIGEKNSISITPLKHKGCQLVADGNALDHMVSSFPWDFVGTCDGLLCFTFSGEEELTMVCNPITREHVTLPKPTITPSPESYGRSLAFGFDPVENKYKVVRVSYKSSEVLAGPGAHWRAAMAELVRADMRSDGRPIVRAEVYTMGTDSWREVQGSNHRPCGKSVYANGIIYWLIYHLNSNDKILSFDLGCAQFKLTPHRRFGHNISLAELGGSLAVVDASAKDSVEISVLQDSTSIYWELKYILPFRIPRCVDRTSSRLISVIELKDILVVWLRDCLLSYDKRAFRTTYLQLSGYPTWLDWQICSCYRASLVPLERSHAGGDERTDVHFISKEELYSLMVKGGAFGERQVGSICDDIVSSFQKNGLLC